MSGLFYFKKKVVKMQEIIDKLNVQVSELM